MNRTLAILFASIGAAALAAACSERDAIPGEPAAEAAPATVTVVHPERGEMSRVITLPGDLAGFYESALYAKVSGYLKTIAVDKGDWVKRGEELAEIEVPELEQKVKRAQAKLEVRRVTYERLKGVWQTDRRLVARQDVDVAQGEYEQARADLDELEALFAYTRILAPFGGVVTARYVDPGALVQAGGRGSAGDGAKGPVPILRLAKIEKLRVYVYVPEEDVSTIRRGMPASLSLREFPGRKFAGNVARFATALDLSTRTMLVEVDLDNPGHELYPGMYADVTLELERRANALRLPATAVAGDRGHSYVYRVERGTLRRVGVETGIAAEGLVEIRSGLRGGEEIVRNVGPGLLDGEKVQTRLTEIAAR